MRPYRSVYRPAWRWHNQNNQSFASDGSMSVWRVVKTVASMSSPGLQVIIILASFLIYMLTKKIPQLVSGLLNGSPQLSGSDMTGVLKSAAGTAASVAATAAGGAGTIQAASVAAKALGQPGLRGTLTQLARNTAMSHGPMKHYRGALDAMAKTVRTTKRLEKEIEKAIKENPKE